MTLVIRLGDGEYQRICHTHGWASVPSIWPEPLECPLCRDRFGCTRYQEAVGVTVAPRDPEAIIVAQDATIRELQANMRELAIAYEALRRGSEVTL
jgi:hypothetical protein